MSDPTPFYIARWIADGILEQHFITLQVAIETALVKNMPDLSEEKMTDLAEKCESEVFSSLGEITDELKFNGTEPSFLLEGEPGTAYIKGQNVEAVQTLLSLKKLSPKEFEQFCSDLLNGLGATAKTVGGANDGGVDFIAYNLPVGKIDIAALHACYPIIIGQAKRYNDKFISITDLRGFLGGALIRADEIKRTYDRYGIFSPTAYAFWTTSEFHHSAREFARNAGLWCLGGLSLAQLALRIGLQDPYSSSGIIK
jgi:restriction endonuclease Mrr